MQKNILAILVATVWISVSEFVRNEFFLKTYWTDHYKGMGLDFPDEPVNGAVWGVWSLVFALVIFLISRRFSLGQTTLIAWLAGFLMMWLVVGNMGVLPFGILYFAVPLSLLEAFLAAYLIHRISTTA